MAWHWSYSFVTNPSAESFVRSHARFLISGGRLEEHLVD
jgi:alpha-ketoglutarate-dependent taurine dioxygenase